MIILVFDIYSNINNENTNTIKSNDIICPLCSENCKLKVSNYRIKLHCFKNGYIIENIKLNDFSYKQNIYKICDICKNNNKSEINDLYKCYNCNINLCSSCKSIHDKTHSIINYDIKNFICNEHDDKLSHYCEDCKIDMCLSCKSEHKNHKVISYEDHLIVIEDIRKELNKFNLAINRSQKNLEEINVKFNKIMENMDMLYNINNEVINKYKTSKNRNSNMLLNLKNINISIKNELKSLRYDYNYGYNLNNLLYLYNEMNEGKEEIEINYILIKNNEKEKNKEKEKNEEDEDEDSE